MTARPILPPRDVLEWSARDVTVCHALGIALQLSGRDDLAALLRETVLELASGIRAPRIADAWRFFDARRALLRYDDTSAPAQAHFFGVRIATACTGLHVVDVSLIEAGSSAAYAVRHETPTGWAEITDAGRHALRAHADHNAAGDFVRPMGAQ